jgi:hypothetical protein
MAFRDYLIYSGNYYAETFDTREAAEAAAKAKSLRNERPVAIYNASEVIMASITDDKVNVVKFSL